MTQTVVKILDSMDALEPFQALKGPTVGALSSSFFPSTPSPLWQVLNHCAKMDAPTLLYWDYGPQHNPSSMGGVAHGKCLVFIVQLLILGFLCLSFVSFRFTPFVSFLSFLSFRFVKFFSENIRSLRDSIPELT